MPVDFTIDTPRRIILSRASGVFTAAEAEDYALRLNTHPHFRANLNHLFDLREVTRMDLSESQIADLANHALFAPESRRAFLVKPGLDLGLARMFATYHGALAGESLAIFTDPDEARAWVNLPKG